MAIAALLLCFALALAPSAFAQAGDSAHPVGVAFRASSLGLGAEGGVALTARTNLRAGFSVFTYERNFKRDGLSYRGDLRLRSFDILLDVYPFGRAFHLTPGLLAWSGNEIVAATNVPAGESFALGGVEYRSSMADPARGTGNVRLNRVAPAILIGWGNLVPRRRHWSIVTDAGVAFHGTPRVTLDFTGSVCDPSGANCRSIGDPECSQISRPSAPNSTATPKAIATIQCSRLPSAIASDAGIRLCGTAAAAVRVRITAYPSNLQRVAVCCIPCSDHASTLRGFTSIET